MEPAFSPASPPRATPAHHGRVASDPAWSSLAVVRSIIGRIPPIRPDARGPPHPNYPDAIPVHRPGGATDATLRRLFNRSPIMLAIGAVVSPTLTAIECMCVHA